MAIHLSERVIKSVANGDQMPNIFVVTFSKEGDSQTYEYVRIDLTDHGTKVREEARQKFDLPPIDEGVECAQQQAEAL